MLSLNTSGIWELLFVILHLKNDVKFVDLL